MARMSPKWWTFIPSVTGCGEYDAHEDLQSNVHTFSLLWTGLQGGQNCEKYGSNSAGTLGEGDQASLYDEPKKMTRLDLEL